MISAAVLPVLLQTDTWIYPVSAVGLTALICILQLISVKAGAHLSESYQPLPAVSADRVKNGPTDPVHGCSQRGCASSRLEILCLASAAGGFYRNVRKIRKTGKECENRNSHHTLRCGKSALCRLLIAEKADLPLAAAAFAAAVLFLLAMRTMRLWTPPAGAMAILPMLIGADQILWYPVQVFGGSVVLILAASVLSIQEKIARLIRTCPSGSNRDGTGISAMSFLWF